MWIEDSSTPCEAKAAEHEGPNQLHADIAEIQACVASLPDRDTRLPDDIIGYDDAGLPS
jgi:hypothetical protein